VMVNRPSNGIFYASYVAAPIFKDLAEQIYTISVDQELQPDSIIHPMPALGYGHDLMALETSLTQAPDSEEAGELDIVLGADGEIHAGQGQMPNVLGLGLRDALYLLEQEGLEVKYKGHGPVKEQFPAAGTELKDRTLAILRLGL